MAQLAQSIMAVMALLSISGFAAAAEKTDEKNDQMQSEGAIKSAKVYFANIKDGDTIKPDYLAKFAVEGLKVEKAGAIVPGTGHFHVIVDAPALAEGQVVPTDATHLHFGKGQTEAPLKLTPGKHTLVLQFADGAHRAYNKMLTQEVNVTVK